MLLLNLKYSKTTFSTISSGPVDCNFAELKSLRNEFHKYFEIWKTWQVAAKWKCFTVNLLIGYFLCVILISHDDLVLDSGQVLDHLEAYAKAATNFVDGFMNFMDRWR